LAAEEFYFEAVLPSFVHFLVELSWTAMAPFAESSIFQIASGFLQPTAHQTAYRRFKSESIESALAGGGPSISELMDADRAPRTSK
jgi:hypothetical protein